MIKNSFNPLQEEEEEENYWSTFMKNSTFFEEFNQIDYIRLDQVRIDEIRFHQVRLGQITVNLLTNSMSFMIENSFNPLQEEEEENYWSTLMKNSTLFQEFNQIGQIRFAQTRLGSLRLGTVQLEIRGFCTYFLLLTTS